MTTQTSLACNQNYATNSCSTQIKASKLMNDVSTPYYKLLDITLILLSSIIAYRLRFEEWGLAPEYLAPTITLAVFCTFGFSATGFYSETNSKVSFKQSYAAAMGVFLAALATASFLYLTKTGELFSRIWFVMGCIMSFLLIVVSRVVISRFFSASVGTKVVILAGGNQTAQLASQRIKDHLDQTTHIKLLEQFAPDNAKTTETYLNSIVQSAIEFRKGNNDADYEIEIWLTADVYNSIELSFLQLILSDAAANIVFIPEFPSIESLHTVEVQNVIGIPVINSNLSKRRKINTALKYIEDRLLGISMITILAPLLALISVLIKLDSKGPVFYKQRRHGFGGNEFEIYKFRTMIYESANEKFVQATKNDARITRIGKILRRTSLDELPQLINVLNGSMSLVGPRPHPIELNNDFRHKIDRFMERHSVKPGITGLAQISGFRGETNELSKMAGRVKYDLEYVRNWSVWLDLKILMLTVFHIVTTDKAF